MTADVRRLLAEKLDLLGVKYARPGQPQSPGVDERGPWVWAYPSGTHVHIFDPTHDEFNLPDIANSLSMLCRFGGSVRRFYSVAQHCVLVAHAVRAAGGSPKTVAAAFLHDASEAYCGDMVYPLKHSGAMQLFCEVDDLVQRTIFEKFGLGGPEFGTDPDYAAVKRFDMDICVAEMHDVVGMGHDSPRGPRPTHIPKIFPWNPRLAYEWYMDETTNALMDIGVTVDT